MKICFTADEPNGLNSVLSYHFGHCPYYVIVEIDRNGNVVRNVRSIPNPLAGGHNPGDLPAFMKKEGINVIITGGMGAQAQQYFADFGIEPVTGAYGRIKDVLEEYIKGKVSYETSRIAEEPKKNKEEENDEIERLKKEAVALREQLADLKSMLKRVEDKLNK